MSERQMIKNRIANKRSQISKLNNDIVELLKRNALLSDATQQFTEEVEDVMIKRRPKIIESKLIGRIHWKEKFKDEDTDKYIEIERSQIVRINGEWV